MTMPNLAEVADMLGAWGNPPPGSVAVDEENEPTERRRLKSASQAAEQGSAVSDESQMSDQRRLASASSRAENTADVEEDAPVERRSCAGEDDETTAPRVIASPRGPVLGRVHSPLEPEGEAAMEPSVDSSAPAAATPSSRPSRWWLVLFVLVLWGGIASIAWLVGDDELPGPPARRAAVELDAAPEPTPDPSLQSRPELLVTEPGLAVEPELIIDEEPVAEPELIIDEEPVAGPERPVGSRPTPGRSGHRSKSEGSASAVEPRPSPEPEPGYDDLPSLVTTPTHEQPDCEQARADADAALRAGDWDRADKLAKQTECWSDSTERLRIRVQALAQAEHYDECLKIGEDLEDKEIKRWVSICRRAQP